MALVVPIFVHKRYVLFHFINGFFFALIVCDLFYFFDIANRRIKLANPCAFSGFWVNRNVFCQDVN